MPIKPWKRWSQPWTREQCGRRYIEGEPIGLRTLEGESGVSVKTLERWSVKDLWVKRRAECEGKVRAVTAERIAEEIGEELSELTVQQLAACKTYRELATIYGDYLLTKCKDNPAELLRIPATAVNFWSLILDRAIGMEREAAGLRYEDVNKAIQFLQSLGYEIIDPTQVAS